MLVLGRHANDTIVIGGGEIVITVIAVRGDKVRLGITAPDDVPVHRGEVQAAIDRERVGVRSGTAERVAKGGAA